MFKSPIAAMKRKFKKHKKWFIVALAFDILSIPAAAQMVDRVSFSVPQKVASAKLKTETPGLQRFVVASNAPFAIVTEDVTGQFNVTLQTNANINNQIIGSNSQIPGAATSCAHVTSTSPYKIYEAVRKTAAKSGDVLTQAVVVNIKYDPSLTPEFKIVTQKNAFDIHAAGLCSVAS
ncbi:MAG: hypothetical protein ABJ275_04020 [Maricaulaceae bacterium]